MAYYRVCPDCGATLDPDEKCDCKVMKERQKELYSQKIKLSPKTGQYSFQWDGKEYRA